MASVNPRPVLGPLSANTSLGPNIPSITSKSQNIVTSTALAQEDQQAFVSNAAGTGVLSKALQRTQEPAPMNVPCLSPPKLFPTADHKRKSSATIDDGLVTKARRVGSPERAAGEHKTQLSSPSTMCSSPPGPNPAKNENLGNTENRSKGNSPVRVLSKEDIQQKAQAMRLRLTLASYKIRTNQIGTPLSRLQIRSTGTDSPSLARLREQQSGKLSSKRTPLPTARSATPRAPSPYGKPMSYAQSFAPPGVVVAGQSGAVGVGVEKTHVEEDVAGKGAGARGGNEDENGNADGKENGNGMGNGLAAGGRSERVTDEDGEGKESAADGLLQLMRTS